MPIPTRSVSLREPRKPSSSITRPVPGTKSAMTAMTKPTARSTTDKTRPPSNPSPVEGTSAKDNGASNRARTLLPQRNNTAIRDDDKLTGDSKPPSTESKLSLRGDLPSKRQPRPTSGGETKDSSTITSASVPSRRQSLLRTGALRVAPTTKTNAPAPTRGAASTVAPPSPRKQAPVRSPAQSSFQRPTSPKKTDMPPPQRHGRSASLRQPPVPTGPPPSVRGHARHRSQMVPPTAKPVQPDPPSAGQKSRPQFSTYQQHYSPKKPAKPPTPTPGTATGSDGLLVPASWPDIAALQTELLQLSLFHSTSLQKHADWKAESEVGLRKKYNEVAGQYRSILGEEKQWQSQLNAQALDRWLQNCREHGGPHEFPQQIQVLSQILQDISDLIAGDVNGRYSRAVDTFETWCEEAETVRHLRESSGTIDGDVFIDPLDQSWKDEVHALSLKLEHCARQLQSLDIPGFGEVEGLEQSALVRVTRGLAELLKLMTQEIRAMRTLEEGLVRAEREAVSRAASQLAGPLRTSAPRVGIWST